MNLHLKVFRFQDGNTSLSIVVIIGIVVYFQCVGDAQRVAPQLKKKICSIPCSIRMGLQFSPFFRRSRVGASC